jgi:hypothetical protein
MNRWLSNLGAIGLVLYAPAGLVVFFFRKLVEKQLALRDVRPWLYVWLPLLLPVPFQLLAGRFPAWLILQCLLTLLASLILTSNVHLKVSLTLALLAALAFGLFERESSKRLWYHDDGLQTTQNLLRGQSVVSGDDPGFYQNGLIKIAKTWELPPDTQNLELSFQAKYMGGKSDWSWYTNNTQTRLEQRQEAGETFTRVYQPPDGKRRIVRRVRTNVAMAGRTVRVSLDVRTAQTTTSEDCYGLRLHTFEESHQVCLGLELTPQWQRFTLETTFPENAQLSGFEFMLDTIDSPFFDVKNVVVEERIGETWRPLSTEPAGGLVILELPDTHPLNWPSLQFIPGTDWQTYQLELQSEKLKELSVARWILQIENGLTIALKNVKLSSPERKLSAQALPRFTLWFTHANLAGHTLVLVGLILLASLRSLWLGIPVAVLMFSCIYFTGSRAAWLASLIALLLLWIMAKAKQRLWLFTAGVMGALLSLSFRDVALGSFRVFNLEDGNTVTRTEIWRVAWPGMLEYPWTGVGAGSPNFVAFWENNPEAPAQIAAHAHNFWLQFAVSFGVPGLVSSLWLTAALLFLGWRWGRWRGFIIVLATFFMNIFDYTFFYTGVLFLLILGLNMLRLEDTKPTRTKL